MSSHFKIALALSAVAMAAFGVWGALQSRQRAGAPTGERTTAATNSSSVPGRVPVAAATFTQARRTAMGATPQRLTRGKAGPGISTKGPLMAEVENAGPEADSLRTMVEVPDVIAVGKVGEILRMAHTPYNSEGSLQHTVFTFRAERYLKADSARPPAVLKVRQEQGNLPWRDGERTGVGFRVAGQPMLKPGSRYILFLNNPARRGHMGGHHVATFRGVSGISGDVDEYTIAFPDRGQILLERGVTRMPTEPGVRTGPPWRFDKGPQILGLPEARAVALIAREYAAYKAEQEAQAKRARKVLEEQDRQPGTVRPPEEVDR